jgi:serine/threonine protein kinase
MDKGRTAPRRRRWLEPRHRPDCRKLGDFQLLRRLGQGGMGQVYLAEQLSLKRKVAPDPPP